MRVVIVEKNENIALEEYFEFSSGTSTITITGKVYHRLTSIIGVFSSADMAKEAIDTEKMRILKEYGEKALDDENIEDNHTFYTFGVYVFDVKEDKEK